MKTKLIAGIIFLFSGLGATSQLVSGTLLPGSSPNSVIFGLKSTAAFTQPFTNVQFVIQIPDNITPIPTVQIKNNILVANIPTYNYNVVNSSTPIAFRNEGGYYNYLFSSVILGGTPFAFTTTTFNVLEVEIINGPPVTPTTVRFACLANGGSSGQHNFYIETNTGDHTNELNMFYGTGFSNSAGGYTGYSFVPLAGVLLPVNWLSFDVVKQGNDGLLNWAVANEDANHHYELQRSTNNTSYTTIATVNKSTNGSTAYNYTDAGINNLSASVLYYRIKQVDINGRISYSDTRTLRLDIKGGQINIFPNPVKDGFYVNIPFTNPDSRKVKLNLISSNGQLISSKQITTAQASNYYFDIKDKNLAAGNYNLQIIFEEKIMDTKKLFVNQ